LADESDVVERHLTKQIESDRLEADRELRPLKETTKKEMDQTLKDLGF